MDDIQLILLKYNPYRIFDCKTKKIKKPKKKFLRERERLAELCKFIQTQSFTNVVISQKERDDVLKEIADLERKLQ